MQNSNQQYWKKIEALLKLSHKQLFFNDLHLKKKKTHKFFWTTAMEHWQEQGREMCYIFQSFCYFYRVYKSFFSLKQV